MVEGDVVVLGVPELGEECDLLLYLGDVFIVWMVQVDDLVCVSTQRARRCMFVVRAAVAIASPCHAQQRAGEEGIEIRQVQ